MDHPAFSMVFNILGGLGIFLMGMKNMSEGMQAIAGNKIRTLISAITSNRFIACGVGTLVTCLIQSSSVTTVMVVGMVNASLMTLRQAIGVILGANIGTTITGWILTLKIGKYGLPILGVSAFFYLFSKRERLHYLAGMFLGVGMVFFGLELMKNGFAPIKQMLAFELWFSKFSPETYFGILKCCLTGAVLTAFVQSSSATLGITIGLATTGVIDFPTAAALVLGENIGTTITALLASIGAGTNAKRAAYAHSIINVVGVLWITSIFWWYLRIIVNVVGHDPSTIGEDGTFIHMSAAIAMVHTGFNVANTVLMLPLIPVLQKLLVTIAPEKHREKPHLTYLNVAILDTPAMGIQQSKVELQRMGRIVEKMLLSLHTMTSRDDFEDEYRKKKAFTREEVLDTIQREIVGFLGNILTGTVPHTVMIEGKAQLRMANEYESIGDYIITILKLHLKTKDHGLVISEQGKQEIIDLHSHVTDYMKMINKAVEKNNRDILRKAIVQGDAITHLMKDYRAKHLSRVETGVTAPLVSLIYMDILNAYRRIKDHSLNIAEALAGEK